MSTSSILSREPPLRVILFSDFEATLAWIFQSREKVLRAFIGMYMLGWPACKFATVRILLPPFTMPLLAISVPIFEEADAVLTSTLPLHKEVKVSLICPQ